MDSRQAIIDSVRDAVAENRPLNICGGDSKAFYGEPRQGERLETGDYSGIVAYDPGELVLTCRAGTPLQEIRQLLADNGQHLPFDPPELGPGATVGGTVACGFSGPSRPWTGALRDYLLGVELVNGKGEALRFGGQVMKNVAGYDISRLMAGSRGRLGVILEASFKVLPRPAREVTLEFQCNQQDALHRISAWARQPLPLSAACWTDDRLLLRLSGAASEVERAALELAAPERGEQGRHWQALREQRLEFFSGDTPLWRLAVPPATEPLDLGGAVLVDWGGAQRWYRSDAPAAEIRHAAEQAGGHATLFRGPPGIDRFHPQPEALQTLQQRIRRAFDPHDLFGRGREA